MQNLFHFLITAVIILACFEATAGRGTSRRIDQVAKVNSSAPVDCGAKALLSEMMTCIRGLYLSKDFEDAVKAAHCPYGPSGSTTEGNLKLYICLSEKGVLPDAFKKWVPTPKEMSRNPELYYPCKGITDGLVYKSCLMDAMTVYPELAKYPRCYDAGDTRSAVGRCLEKAQAADLNRLKPANEAESGEGID